MTGIYQMAAYSGTPLYRKLGIKHGQKIGMISEPKGFGAVLAFPEGVRVVPRTSVAGDLDLLLLFVRLREELEREFPRAARRLTPAGSLWVAWPKLAARKAQGIASDMTDHVVRDVALPLGFVDIKVCAIDETWSGLKCVLRVSNRPRTSEGRR